MTKMLRLTDEVHHVEVYMKDSRMVKFFPKDLDSLSKYTDEEFDKVDLERKIATARYKSDEARIKELEEQYLELWDNFDDEEATGEEWKKFLDRADAIREARK